MKALQIPSLIFALFLIQPSAEARQWTGANGNVIEAEYVGVNDDGTEVALRLPDGKIVKTPVANLSKADQELIEKIRKEGPQIIPATFNYGDIKPEYLPPSPWPVVEFKDPGNWTTIDVTKHGLSPNSNVDAAVAVAEILRKTDGRRRLFFPAGTYTLKSPLDIHLSDIWLDGVGDDTKFVLDFPEKEGMNGITFAGGEDEPLELAKLPKRGDATVELAGSHDLKVGELVRVHHPVHDNRKLGFPRGQISYLTAIDGKSVTLDLKIGADFADPARITRLRPLRNVRLTNFSLTRLRRGGFGDNNILLQFCANLEVRNVTSSKATTHCISIRSCRDTLVTGCTVHDSHGGKGWTGYGVTVEHSTAVNVVNCHGYNLRHHFELAWGTSYSVMAYNTTKPTYDYCDFGSHHADLGYCNLFEGNQGQDVVLDWGESIWNAYTFFYRNQASRRLGSFRPKRSQHWYPVYIGNEVTATCRSSVAGIGTQGVREPYIGANLIKGEMRWGDVPEGSRLPASLFLSTKPEYLKDKNWPLFGPPAAK